MDFSIRVRNFLKTGKINFYEQLKGLLSEQEEDKRLLLEILNKLSDEEKERLLTECWPKLTDYQKKVIVNNRHEDKGAALINGYDSLTELEQVKRLELLGYLSYGEVVEFLLEQMKSKREAIRLTACGALKKQNPQLVVEPVLKALLQPEKWLPSRVFEILQAMGSGVNGQLLELMAKADEKGQEVIVQVLGEIGDRSCLPVFGEILPRAGDGLRLRITEALEKLKLKESWSLLAKLLDDERWQIRMQSAKALGQLGLEEARLLLVARGEIEEDSLVKECINDALVVSEEVRAQVITSWVREG